eukprot:jgi/Botrbrau1/18288/Bobra.0179s0019.1
MAESESSQAGAINPPRISWNDLPQEVWTIVLSFLGPCDIRIARLVSTTLRSASIPCIETLDVRYGRHSNPDRVSEYAKLRKILGVFSKVTDLYLSIWLPRHANLLEPPAEGPAVAPLLDNLQVHFDRQVHFGLNAEGALHVLAVKLESATKLKSLGIYDVGGVLGPPSKEDLALAVGNCRVLQNLDISFSDNDDILYRAQVGRTLAAHLGTNLRSLCITPADFEFFEPLLPLASTLPCLQNLRHVNVDNITRGVAPLTQLTALSVQNTGVWVEALTPLSNLSSLEELELYCGPSPPADWNLPFEDLQHVIQPMTKLRYIRLDQVILDPAGDMEVMGLRNLLEQQTSVTRLAFTRDVDVAACIAHAPGFSRLRALSLSLSDRALQDLWGLRQLANSWASLEHLSLTCPIRTCLVFVEHLKHMPQLTSLQLTAAGLLVPESDMSARFLTGVRQLKELRLYKVLCRNGWASDVNYITALTGLTSLGLTGSWKTGSEGARPRGVPTPYPPQFNQQPLTSADLQPLMALTKLRTLTLLGDWQPASAAEFLGNLKEKWFQMGLPLPVCSFIIN